MIVNNAEKEAVLKLYISKCDLEKEVQFEKSNLSEYITLMDDVIEVAKGNLDFIDDVIQASKVQMRIIQEPQETLPNQEKIGNELNLIT